jgi:hypothetical protein
MIKGGWRGHCECWFLERGTNWLTVASNDGRFSMEKPITRSRGTPRKKARLIRRESSGKTALHRYRGAFRAILWGNVQKGAADLHLLAVARLVSPELGPQPQREEIQPSAKQWRNFRKRSIGSTSGAGNLITLIQPSATGPVGRLKSFTRIDR